jgi:hypothetical protein
MSPKEEVLSNPAYLIELSHPLARYRGLHIRAQIILSVVAEMCTLVCEQNPEARQLPVEDDDDDRYDMLWSCDGDGFVAFADGTRYEVFIQKRSEHGGDYWPAYLALKNHLGQIIPSSLWTDEQIESCEGSLSLIPADTAFCW